MSQDNGDKLDILRKDIIENVSSYYETWQLPIKFGYLFRRFSSQLHALKTTGTEMTNSLESEGIIFSMQSHKNRRFIFPNSAKSEDEAVILDQLMTAEKNL